MFRFAKNAAAALALAGLVVAQPALAVRSSQSLPAPSAKISAVDSRVGSPMGRQQNIASISVVGWLIIVTLITGAIIIIIDDNKKHHHSPG